MAKARTPRVPKPKAEKAETKVLQMPETAAAANGNGNSNHSAVDVESEIRRRAYELYESRGYVDGQAIEDWIQAEREVRARQSQKHSA
ncbi:MAG TPA: DUF2934 domain-containing protein [Terriglobales bacterium]|jgi:Protein of unknown function (DUF2934)|nr:DUF2934 domain-containing protein [Terriglobales bacterium]